MNFQQVEFELAAGVPGQLPKSTYPEIVFSGRSNVGKSSLINKLVNRKALARTSATPGKTATINFYKLTECRFVDLPGYGYAKVSRAEKERWGNLVDGYFAQKRNIALVLQLVDMRHKPTADDVQMLDFLSASCLPFAVVCTKCDKLNKTETRTQMDLFRQLFNSYGVKFYPFSAIKGDGVEEIKAKIAASVNESCNSERDD